eukprot:gene20959-27812_t
MGKIAAKRTRPAADAAPPPSQEPHADPGGDHEEAKEEEPVYGVDDDGNLMFLGEGVKASVKKEGEPSQKEPRLGDDIVAKLPVGANLVEFDGKACTHEVAWPPNAPPGSELPPPKKEGLPPAREYPFRIDPFQQTAINALETLFPQYRSFCFGGCTHVSWKDSYRRIMHLCMALRDKTRCIYTSPLKALSNQKYRELYEQFRDILRSMLYRGSEVVREVQLLVYDEIHYLRDKERGVVWEESIIMAPKACRFAFLSATIPNAREFVEWIAKVHESPCHVVYTDYRPTPLQHYIFPTGGDGLYMVVDERGAFREDNFQKAVAAITNTAADGGGKAKAKKPLAQGQATGEKSDIFKIVIIFSFSKKEVESLSMNMSALDLTDADEKKLIHSIYWNAMDCLSKEDQKLPQITHLLPMLKRGIGLHHSGLLPIVKEVIEILFQEGLLKALFATETFSTGLNMPAKTVIFTNVKKFDGGAFRNISSGEYIQMSGRAGRRGLDDRGVVVLMLDSRLEPPVAKEMIKGAPDTMYSEFHLGYNMLLSLLRVAGADPEQLMASSFRQFQVERSLPKLEENVQMLKNQRDAVEIEDEDQVEGFLGLLEVEGFLGLLEQYAQLQDELRASINAPQHSLPFLQPGRLVRLLPTPYDPSSPVPDFSKPAPSTSATPAVEADSKPTAAADAEEPVRDAK